MFSCNRRKWWYQLSNNPNPPFLVPRNAFLTVCMLSFGIDRAYGDHDESGWCIDYWLGSLSKVLVLMGETRELSFVLSKLSRSVQHCWHVIGAQLYRITPGVPHCGIIRNLLFTGLFLKGGFASHQRIYIRGCSFVVGTLMLTCLALSCLVIIGVVSLV